MEPIGSTLGDLAQSAKHLIASTNDSVVTLAAMRARLLLGCYRTDEAQDPDIFVTAFTAVLARYSPEIMHAVTDPAKGLPSRLKWLPSIAELRAECDRLAEIAKASEQRKANLEKQIAEAIKREHELASLPLRAPRLRGKIYDATEFSEAVANHGRPFGVFEQAREIPYRE